MKGNWIYEIDAPETDLQEVRHWTSGRCPNWLAILFIVIPFVMLCCPMVLVIGL